MSATDALNAAGRSIPCGKREARASSSHQNGLLSPFPRLAEHELDEGPRKIRRRRYQEASKIFRDAFDRALSRLYAPAVADLTEYFLALNRNVSEQVRPPLWIPGSSTSLGSVATSSAITADLLTPRIPTALLLQDLTAQSPAFYEELDRSFSKHALRMVRLMGRECGTYRATIQLITNRLIKAATNHDEGEPDADAFAPTTLLELASHLKSKSTSSSQPIIIHFPVVEDFPARLLSDLILALSQACLPIAFLMGVGSLDAYDQAIRSMETRAALEFSRFAITSGGPDEVFGRVISQIFLDPIQPPPLYLDAETYEFLFNQYYKNDNDIEAVFDAVDLAVLHHFHTRAFSAFAASPVLSHTQDLEAVNASSWSAGLIKTIRNAALGSVASTTSSGTVVLKEGKDLRVVPSAIPIVGRSPLDIDKEATREERHKAHVLRLIEDDDYLLSQAPGYRRCIDTHMAWQARALSLLCCIQRFLTDEPSQDLRFNGSEDALRYARRAQYALIADGEHDLLGSALAADGEPGAKKPGSEEPGSKGEKGLARTLLLAEVRMNRLDQKSYSIMLELIGRVLAGMIRAFNDKQNEAIHAPDEDEDEEYDDDDDDEKDRAKGHRPYSVKLESEELSDFDETIQEMASSIEAWRVDEEAARIKAERAQKAAEIQAQVRLDAFTEDEDAGASAGRGRDERDDDDDVDPPGSDSGVGRSTTFVAGPLLLARRMTKDQLAADLQRSIKGMAKDETTRRLQAEATYEELRAKTTTYITNFLRSKSQPLGPVTLGTKQKERKTKPGQQAVVLLKDVWRLNASTHLTTHLDATPRQDIIKQLDDPFTSLDRYGLEALVEYSSQISAEADEQRGRKVNVQGIVDDMKQLRRSNALPDICLAFTQYRQAPRFFNLADAFDNFCQQVQGSQAFLRFETDSTEGESAKANGNGKRKRDEVEVEEDEQASENEDRAEAVNAAPKRSRRLAAKDNDVTPTRTRATANSTPTAAATPTPGPQRKPIDAPLSEQERQHLQARFALALNELAIMGFLKGTRRKVEHTTKLIFDIGKSLDDE